LAPGLKEDLKAYYKTVIAKEHVAEEKTAAKEKKKPKSKAKA